MLSNNLECLSNETRLQMHYSMLRIRMVEETIASLYSEQEMRCPTHFCVGQEAVPVGVSEHLLSSDFAFSGHRSHGHYLAKGGNLKSMLCELYGKEAGCALGRGGSQHLIDLDSGFVASAPILAGTLPIAVGSVFGTDPKEPERISVVYFGDGATEEGVFHETLNFASVRKLPVIFVCENNLYSVHSSFSVRQPVGRTIADIGKAHMIPGETADGNDVEMVWSYSKSAVERARSGGGPTLLEFKTYRWLEHCGPNEDIILDYRSREELDEWQERCPIHIYQSRLIQEGLLNKEQIKETKKKIELELDESFDYAKSMPFPDPETLMNYTLPEYF